MIFHLADYVVDHLLKPSIPTIIVRNHNLPFMNVGLMEMAE